MASGMAASGTGPITLDDYVRAHAEANPADLLKLLQQRERIPINADGSFAPRTLEDVYRIGKMYADSDLVPDAYKGKPANCAVAIEYAQQLGVPPLFFMQQSFIVRGKPAISAALMIALLNKSKKLKTSLRYESGGEGNGRWWRATAVDASTGQEVSFTVTWSMVESEGWHLDKREQKSKWATLPDLMGRYRSASYLIRTHYPDVLMGLTEVEELRDAAITEERERTPQRSIAAPVHDLAGLARVAAEQPTTLTTEFPKSAPPEKAETRVETAASPADDSPTLAAGEIPPLDAYSADLDECTTVAESGKVYDKWFGPESRTPWTPEQNQRGYELWQARKEQLRK